MNVPLDNFLLRLPSCCYDTLVFEHFKIIFWGYFSFFQRLEQLLRPKLLKEWWKESSLNSPMLVFTPLVNINDFSSYLWFSLGKETSTTQLNHNKFPISFLFTFLFQVFDDGDERTLRRTSLCLKGERHFNESEVCNLKKNHYSDLFLSLLGHWSESVKKSDKPLFLFPYSLDSRSSTSDRSRKFWYSSCSGIVELLIKLLLLIKTPVLIHDHIMIISFEHLLFTVLHCRLDVFIFFYIVIILYKKVNFLEISTTCSPFGNL